MKLYVIKYPTHIAVSNRPYKNDGISWHYDIHDPSEEDFSLDKRRNEEIYEFLITKYTLDPRKPKEIEL